MTNNTEQEPVAWYGKSKTGNILLSVNCVDEDWKPLYVASVKHVKQEPVGEVDIHMDFLRINWKDGRHPPKGTKLYAAPVEPMKQEPVACPVCGNGYLVKRTEEYCNSCGSVCMSPQTIQENVASKIAAPVRTKDLTDDEIVELWRECEGMSVEDYARAVIAVYREKNNANNNT